MNKLISLALASVCLLGCSSNGVNRGDINQFVEIIYGKVIRTEPIVFDSKADEAAVIGGIEGAIENSDEHFDDVITGAVVGGIVAALFVRVEEGSNQGLIVDLKTTDHNNVSMTLKTRNIDIADCLRIVKGEEISFKKVADSFCD